MLNLAVYCIDSGQMAQMYRLALLYTVGTGFTNSVRTLFHIQIKRNLKIMVKPVFKDHPWEMNNLVLSKETKYMAVIDRKLTV